MSTHICPFEQPKEIWSHIFSFINPLEFYSARLVCRAFKTILDEIPPNRNKCLEWKINLKDTLAYKLSLLKKQRNILLWIKGNYNPTIITFTANSPLETIPNEHLEIIQWRANIFDQLSLPQILSSCVVKFHSENTQLCHNQPIFQNYFIEIFFGGKEKSRKIKLTIGESLKRKLFHLTTRETSIPNYFCIMDLYDSWSYLIHESELLNAQESIPLDRFRCIKSSYFNCHTIMDKSESLWMAQRNQDHYTGVFKLNINDKPNLYTFFPKNCYVLETIQGITYEFHCVTNQNPMKLFCKEVTTINLGEEEEVLELEYSSYLEKKNTRDICIYQNNNHIIILDKNFKDLGICYYCEMKEWKKGNRKFIYWKELRNANISHSDIGFCLYSEKDCNQLYLLIIDEQSLKTRELSVQLDKNKKDDDDIQEFATLFHWEKSGNFARKIYTQEYQLYDFSKDSFIILNN